MILNNVLCSISTKGRYDTTLPLAIQSVLNQTKLPHKLVIFDDNDEPKDLRTIPHYMNLFRMLEIKRIKWEVIFGAKKGQHHNHQIANKMGYEFVWRIDDDTIPEYRVLENLYSFVDKKIGAVGGAILTPEWDMSPRNSTGKMENIDIESSIQWGIINKYKEVDHLHCSFLYRAGVADYNLGLSKVAHREETLFTYELKQKGYNVCVIPNTITWHLKSPNGGIRTTNNKHLYDHDNEIFNNIVKNKKQGTIVVLDCGMGDHVVFKHVLPKLKNPVIFSCYPEIIPGRSIQEAKDLFGDIEQYNVYRKMDEWNWKDSLQKAFEKIYGVSN
jgi:GT2 family glycosyltransferase